MRVYDPLYGKYDISPSFLKLIACAEIQRLRDIRLLNFHSTTFPAMSDIRRYTHIMGVFHLGEHLMNSLGCPTESRERIEFLCACLLHDIGTPPLAHLLEYRLRDKFQWNHESAAKDLLLGTISRSGRHFQLYYNAPISAYKILESLHVDIEKILDMICGSSQWGGLLNGQIDIDNMDNVNRMAWGLGVPLLSIQIKRIIAGMKIEGESIFYTRDCIGAISDWVETRSKVYGKLLNDPQTTAAQCMLSECLDTAIEAEFITPEHWFCTDEQILRLLQGNKNTKVLITRLMNFDLYQHIATLNIHGHELYPIICENSAILTGKLSALVDDQVSLYIYREKGSLAKRLEISIHNPEGSESVLLSQQSSSVIVSVFSRNNKRASTQTIRKITSALHVFFLEQLGIEVDNSLFNQDSAGGD